MIVVADATPLNYWCSLGTSGVLSQLCHKVVIPTAVLEELQRSRTPEPVRRWISAAPDWLEIGMVRPYAAAGMEQLGAGEREAILLAEEIKADWLIMDDYEGRQEAARRRLPVIGTVRVLDESANRGLIDLVEAVNRLEQTTFYLSSELLQWLMDRHSKREKNPDPSIH